MDSTTRDLWYIVPTFGYRVCQAKRDNTMGLPEIVGRVRPSLKRLFGRLFEILGQLNMRQWVLLTAAFLFEVACLVDIVTFRPGQGGVIGILGTDSLNMTNRCGLCTVSNMAVLFVLLQVLQTRKPDGDETDA